jgi:hypothetical protein
MNQLDFNGRHAVITGGAAGWALRLRSACIASGGSVTLWDFDPLRWRQGCPAALGPGERCQGGRESA